MNAPRQGLFASLLAFAFALIAVLLIYSASQQAERTRMAQGALLLRQLGDEASAPLSTNDPVSLALLVNRYDQSPELLHVSIANQGNRVLATGGNAPSRNGQVFRQAVLNDGKPLGNVELTLAVPSTGELMRSEWFPLLGAAGVFIALWLLYRLVARPASRVDTLSATDLAPIDQPLVTPTLPEVGAAPSEPTPPPAPLWIYLNFYDPRSLLDSVSPSTATHYLRLCQTLIDQAIARYSTDTTAITRVSAFDHQGVWLHVQSISLRPLEHSVRVASVLNQLLNQVYLFHRQERLFGLPVRAVVIASSPDAQATEREQSASQHHSREQARLLLPHASAAELWIDAPSSDMDQLSQRFSLKPVPVALGHGLQDRQRMRLGPLSNEQLRLLHSDLRLLLKRDLILEGRG